jgi:hypothetical protein
VTHQTQLGVHQIGDEALQQHALAPPGGRRPRSGYFNMIHGACREIILIGN